MDIGSRLDLVLRPPAEEVVTVEELRELLETNDRPRHYIGFEISGPLHLGSLVVAGFKIRDFIEAGFEATIFLADWHSYINDKLGGDWDRIRRAAQLYKKAFNFFTPGARVVLGSELYEAEREYWEWLVRFAKKTTIARVTRTLTIMGRRVRDVVDMAQYIYPLMQAIDIKALGVDVAHAGLDQRKVHMLVRDVYPRLGWRPPVAVHHHLLIGLQEPRGEGLEDNKDLDVRVSSKMSKSKPDSAIFVHDDQETVEQKIRTAWCPPRSAVNNPVLELVKHVVFRVEKEFLVERPRKYGGDVVYGSYEELERSYVNGELHPLDLKLAVAREINKVIDPVRRLLLSDKDYLELLS